MFCFLIVGLKLAAPVGNSHYASRQFSSLHFGDQVHSSAEEVVIASGSNVGNRVQNFNEALRLMKKQGINMGGKFLMWKLQFLRLGG